DYEVVGATRLDDDNPRGNRGVRGGARGWQRRRIGHDLIASCSNWAEFEPSVAIGQGARYEFFDRIGLSASLRSYSFGLLLEPYSRIGDRLPTLRGRRHEYQPSAQAALDHVPRDQSVKRQFACPQRRLKVEASAVSRLDY